MSLLAIARKAAALAMTVAGDVKKPVTVYTGPTYTYDSEQNATATAWARTKPCQGFIYDATEKKPDAKPETVFCTLIVEGADFDGVDVTQESEVDTPAGHWNVWRVGGDPARGIIILDLYR